MVSKTDQVKIKERSKITKDFYRKGQYPVIFTELNKISIECSNLIINAKIGYIR